MNNQRTMGQRGARVLIWLCVLVAQSLYAASVLKLAGTPKENWIIVTLSLALVVVGMLMGFNFAIGLGGPRRPPRTAANRGNQGKPDGSPFREVAGNVQRVSRPMPVSNPDRISSMINDYQNRRG